MRIIKAVLTVLTLVVISALSLSCASGEDLTPASENEVVTIQRGDLTVDINAVGNLALSLKENLAFEIPGTVEEVLVEEGETVEEGQVLVKLDTSEWEKQLDALEDKVRVSKRQLTTAERQLTAAERQLTARQRDLLQAKINLKNAEIALEKTSTTYSLSDFKVAQANVDEAQRNLDDALLKLTQYDEGSPGYVVFQKVVLQAQARLDTAKAKVDAMLSGFDTEEVAIKKLQVEIAQAKLEDAKIAIEDAQKGITDAQTTIEDAQKDVEDAQKELDEALEASPEITAPFDGFITRVNVDGGDEVKKGTVAIVLADPTKFEADVLVNETDIFQVRLGGEASVQVDAMPTINLPARVTHISPSATIQAGVVNYKVKVEIQSLTPVMQERQEARQKTRPNIAAGELPPRLQQAVKEGRITQEQAEEMLRRIQSGEIPFPRAGGQGQRPFSPEDRSGQTMKPGNLQLKEGLTVTVSILVDKRQNVLLVPNSAITSQGGQTYVNIMTSEGTIENREIQTGISDWQYSEVTGGLSEGEQVVISRTKTTTPTTETPQPRRRLPFLPGGRRKAP